MGRRGAERLPRVDRVYLTGFMGAGKTATGRGLAAALKWRFVDLDGRVEAVAGQSVPEIIERRGEEAFRSLERAALEETLGDRRVVVATGGGTLAQPGAVELLRGRGLIVWLELPFAELARRVEAAGVGARPLYGSRRRARQLYRERLPFYRQADLVVTVGGDEPVASVVGRLAAELGVEACAI